MRSVFKFVLGLCATIILTGVIFFGSMLGYFSAACSAGADPVGWTLLVLLFCPLIIPILGVAWLALAVGITAVVKPAESLTKLRKLTGTSIGIAVVLGVVIWIISNAESLHTRCGFGGS